MHYAASAKNHTDYFIIAGHPVCLSDDFNKCLRLLLNSQILYSTMLLLYCLGFSINLNFHNDELPQKQTDDQFLMMMMNYEK